MVSAFFIGRFQPYHCGHDHAIRDIADVNGHVIIGVGSSQEHHVVDNPFTVKERCEMISRSLGADVNYTLVPIPDINDYPKWVAHVVSLTPEFNVVYTGNEIVRKLFERERYEVRSVNKHSSYISATEVRNMMARGDDSWKLLVPQGTLEVILECDGINRVKDTLNSKFRKPAVTVDALVVRENKILLVKRRNYPFKDMWAIPGGFVDYGESTEEAVARELLEETSLNARQVKLAGVYSGMRRDPRGHSVSIVYEVDAEGEAKAGDDAKELEFFDVANLPQLAFDHEQIIAECILKKFK